MKKNASYIVAIAFIGIAVFIQIQSGITGIVPVIMGFVSGLIIGNLLTKK